MNADQLTIRPAMPNDLEAVHAVTQAAYAQIAPFIGAQSSVYAETPGALNERLDTGWTILLAMNGDRIVGAVRCQEHEGEMYLGRLAVFPDVQHAGIGRALVEAVEAHGRALGLPTVRLGAYEDVAISRTYYERLGYRVDERVELRSAPGRYYWQMRKRLDGVQGEG